MLTDKQLTFIKRAIHFHGIEIILEVVPNFKPEQINQVTKEEFIKIVQNIKKYLGPSSEYVDKLEPYQDKIRQMFGKTIYQLNLDDLEKIIWKFPELNLPYVIKKFNLAPVDFPINYNSNYEYGYQTSPVCLNQQMYYLKFYDLLVIDYDHLTLEEVTSKASQFCLEYPSFLFNLYQTYNGFHLMLISHAIPYYQPEAEKLMTHLESDAWYIVFSIKNGYRLRLNPKIRREREETEVATLVGQIGTGQVHPRCQAMIAIYHHYLANPIRPLTQPINSFYHYFIKNIIWCKSQVSKPESSINADINPYIIPEINPESITIDDINKYSEIVKPRLQKPQQLLVDNPDYYIAIDQYTRTIYISYRNLLMIDLDLDKSGISEPIEDYLKRHFNPEQSAVEIYRTLHGYHLFLIDQERPYQQKEHIIRMYQWRCDPNYCLYSYLRGYCVRLNRKNYQSDLTREDIYQYVGFFGNRSIIHEPLQQYVNLHLKLMKQYQNQLVSCMS